MNLPLIYRKRMYNWLMEKCFPGMGVGCGILVSMLKSIFIDFCRGFRYQVLIFL